ncbi:TonB-dependent receptor [Alkalisalibacterium limincola]|uniref:TonB-dependent receptor n=1 Tax=Alkalisalibacterium limincola TaxID=2699169 RepID=A0A5C8KVE9_9GAMM|nr:TonB-dependent receptor [Alkalisalibacterium limincola]TXK65729.1 TonB-dependent receptor [Alkalisalibacterium limincola]
MKRTSLSLSIHVALGLALGLAAAASAQAQEQDAPETGASATRLDAIAVTARRREETLQDVPVAVTAFTPEVLDTFDINDMGDIGVHVPNLTVYAARGSSSTITAYIRGVGQADPLWGVDPGVGIYLDDVYIARPQGALLDVFDVAGVEVLRGPQGTLYGKNTIGGAIKYISRPLPTQPEGYGKLTLGNYNQADFQGAVGGPVNEVVRARLAVASLNRDGFGENIVTGQDVSDKSIFATRFSIGLFPSDTFDVQLSADYMDDGSGVRGSKMLAANPFSPTELPLDSRYDVRSGMPNINDTTMSGASVTASWYPGNAWSFKSITAHRESDTETNIDFDNLQATLADVKAFYSDSQFSQELQASYDAGGAHRGVMGIYYFDGKAGGQVLNNFFGLLFGDTQGEVETESVAVYGDWIFDLGDRWSLNAGLRWTEETKRADVLNRGYSDATYTTPIAVVADFNDSLKISNFSPKLSLDYRVTDDILLYGVLSRGFKSGGFNIRAQTVAVPRSAEPFADEKVDSFEIGSKMAFMDNRAFLNLAYFYNKYQDIQLSTFTAYDSNGDGVEDAFFGDFTNAGKGTVQGVEVEYQILPTERFSITGNLAFLDAKYDEYIFQGVDISGSQKFTNAPEFSGALNLQYSLPLAAGGELRFRGTYSYQSEVIPTTDLSPAITQSGYGLLGAGVIWDTGRDWQFALQGSNLTDREYRTTGYNIPALGVLTGFYGAPRQVSLSARYSF